MTKGNHVESHTDWSSGAMQYAVGMGSGAYMTHEQPGDRTSSVYESEKVG
jgi:hypothetical protein